jgi:ubiquinone/menaquinone biosynthesis C-methylase UbiE
LSTAEVFENLSERYDMWYAKNKITAYNELLLVKTISTNKPPPCLEVGVGTGFFAKAINCRFGIDPSPKMISKALSRGVDAIVGVGEKLPIRSSSIGTLIFIVTICFLDDPIKALNEAWRVLKRGGFLITCIVPRESPWGRLYVRESLKGHPFYSVARFYRVKEILDTAHAVGFKHIKTLATLSYRPWDKARPERPRSFKGKEGFVCMEFKKVDEEARKG